MRQKEQMYRIMREMKSELNKQSEDVPEPMAAKRNYKGMSPRVVYSSPSRSPLGIFTSNEVQGDTKAMNMLGSVGFQE